MDELPPRATVVIVGGGFAGAATAWWLARDGVDVVVVEREDLLGLHASGRNAGMCRQLAEDDTWTSLCARGARWLREPPSGFGASPLTITGSLLVADAAVTLGTLAARARAHGVRHRVVTRDEVWARVPAVAGMPCEGAIEAPDDGVIDATALLHGLAGGARRAGAKIVVRAEVEATRAVADDEVEVTTTRGVVRARAVVCAAGAWAGQVGARAGASDVAFAAMKRHLFFLAQAPAGPAVGDPFVWHVGPARDREVYVRNGADGLIASACDATRVEPGDVRVDPEAPARLAARFAAMAPALADRAVTATWACLRTYAPEGPPRIGWDRDVSWLFWVAGLGGHGATSAFAAGEDAAAALLLRLR